MSHTITMENKSQWVFLVFLLHILSGHIVSSIAEKPEFNSKLRNWNWNRSPSISNATESEVLVTLGQTAYLHCVVGYLGDRQVSWIRTQGIRVLAIGKVRYTQDTRFTPLHDDGNDLFALKIQETRLSDAGLYECQVSYHEDEEKLKMSVRLIVLDSFAIIKGSAERHVKEGSQLSLFCAIEDSSGPPNYVFWYRDDHVVNYSDEMGIQILTDPDQIQDQLIKSTQIRSKHDNSSQNSATITLHLTSGPEIVSSLLIQTVKPRDAGTYTCAPSNARNYSVVVHVIKGENLAMQRQENEKKDIPVVQKNQASSDVRLEPSFLSIIQSFLVVIFGYIQILWTTTRPNSSRETILNRR